MLDALLHWVETLPPGWAWLWVACAAAAEYVVPPLPGDTLVLFAMFLSAHAERGPLVVLLAATTGAVLGSLAAWTFGRFLGRDPGRWPAFLRTPARRARIEAMQVRYAQRAGLWLLANRFLPAFRAFFFVAAGIAGVPSWKVVVFGGLSAAVWNAILLGLAWTVATEFDRLRALSETYATAVGVGAVAVLVVWLSYRWWQGRAARLREP